MYSSISCIFTDSCKSFSTFSRNNYTAYMYYINRKCCIIWIASPGHMDT